MSLLKWKRAKFAITGKYDVLSADWTQSLIRTLWERGEKADLRCDMHALYFGERLAAIDLGLSDGKVFHSWMVAYDDELAEFGPGIQLLEALIEATTDINVITAAPRSASSLGLYRFLARRADSRVFTPPQSAGASGRSKMRRVNSAAAIRKLRPARTGLQGGSNICLLPWPIAAKAKRFHNSMIEIQGAGFGPRLFSCRRLKRHLGETLWFALIQRRRVAR